jgi:hypothetical protein
MTGMREKDSADFDLEAFIDLFDEALTSDDPGVQKTLQHLMVIAALARNHAKHDHRDGPMRRMFENQRDLIRRLERLESNNQNLRGGYPGTIPGGGNIPLGPYVPGTPWPGTGGGTGWPPQPGTYPPGTIWAQSGTATGMTLDPGYGAVPPTTNTSETIAERVEDLLKSSYNGSSVGTVNVKIA